MNRTAALIAFSAIFLGASTQASAEDFEHIVTSNAIDKCQAFTPGVTNTIRNRVIGAENVGTKPISIACSFELDEIKGFGDASIKEVVLEFQNNAAAPVDINCSLRLGKAGLTLGDQVNGTIEEVPGNGQIRVLEFNNINDASGAVGVVCNLPPKVAMTHTRISYESSNGVVP